MTKRISTYVYAKDPVSQAGIMAQLRPRPEIDVMEDEAIDSAAASAVQSSAASLSGRTRRPSRRRRKRPTRTG